MCNACFSWDFTLHVEVDRSILVRLARGRNRASVNVLGR